MKSNKVPSLPVSSKSKRAANAEASPQIARASAEKRVRQAGKAKAPRFVMLGGFLGAGKTTTVLRAAQYFQRAGMKVGLITNDQAQGLVDTALLEELDLPVREIAGGCFCCRSESLVEALERLTADKQPDVFIAEPVGSCTDLIATVSLPLERIYRKNFIMAPYAVLVDPYRAMQSLGVEGEPLFSSDVNDIYRKQLEEAEIIAINKVDVMAPERLARLRAALEAEYPLARIVEMASRPGIGMEPLFEALATGTASISRVMDVDYARYGVGEALLGWVNLQGDLVMDRETESPGMDTDALLQGIAADIQKTLTKKKVEIAHLKISLSCGEGRLGAVQLVHSAGVPEMTRSAGTSATGGRLLLNLRAEGAPDPLAAAVFRSLVRQLRRIKGLRLENMRSEQFRPGQPNPVHRVAAA